MRYLGIWHFVTPFDAKDAAKTVQVEAVQLPLLFGVCCPGLTAIQEHADDAGIGHCHLSWDCELWILPDMCCKSAWNCCGLPNTFVNLHIEEQVVADGRP